MDNKVKVVIEIPKNTRVKYEIDKKTGRLAVDRILHGSNLYPQNYGYIEGTLDYDNDPLDVLVISQEILFPLCEVEVRLVGALKMIDGGERDTKLLAVIDSDPRYSEYQDLNNIPKGVLGEIQDFFKNYKNLEGKTVELGGFLNKEETLKVLAEGRNLFNSKK